MGFRFQRRVNLTRGLGLNISNSGISPSYRTGFGSIGTKGFSLRTGIPGLTYRQGFGKGGGGAGLVIGLIFLAIALIPVVIVVCVWVFQLLALLAVWLYRLLIAIGNIAVWCGQTAYDYIQYKRGIAPAGSANIPALAAGSPPAAGVSANQTLTRNQLTFCVVLSLCLALLLVWALR